MYLAANDKKTKQGRRNGKCINVCPKTILSYAMIEGKGNDNGK